MAAPFKSKPPLGNTLMRGHPLAQGLVGCYLFNEGAGLSARDSSGINHGTLTAATWAAGRIGKTLSFNGTSAYVGLGSPNALNFTPQTNAFSLGCWIKINGHPAVNAQIISKGNSAHAQYQLTVQNTDGKLIVNLGDTSTSAGTVDVTDNIWHFVMLTVPAASTGAQLYLDGKVHGSTSSIGTVTVAVDTLVGARRDVSNVDSLRWFPGSIDDVRFYNRVLTANQVRDLYTMPYAMFSSSRRRMVTQHASATSGLLLRRRRMAVTG